MIHPTAIISSKAQISSKVNIGPYCIIEDNVKIDDDNILISNVHISGHTTIGKRNIFHSFCSIGSIPQDLKYKGEKSYLHIGDDNKFRENVTVNLGTEGGGLKTTIKNNCLLMVGSHVAHDCLIDSNVILANNATLAGHVELNDNVIIGGNSAIHQFVKVGKFAMIGGMSGVEKNIIPYGLYTGIRTDLKGINVIGLKRKGLENNTISKIIDVVKIIFKKDNSIENNLNNIHDDYKKILEINEILDFVLNTKKRGLSKYNHD